MIDPQGSYKVKVRKVDPNNLPLPGAELQITGKRKLSDGSEVEIEPITWTSTAEDEEIVLYPGTYILSEVTAPEGYNIAVPIKFTVENNDTDEVVVKIDGKIVESAAIIMIDGIITLPETGGPGILELLAFGLFLILFGIGSKNTLKKNTKKITR